MPPNYYDVLGVQRHASQAEIERAYHRLARKYHPDLNRTDSAAKERFQEIQVAAEVLRNPENRKAYDQYLHFVDSLRRQIREEESKRFAEQEAENAKKSREESIAHEAARAKAWEDARRKAAELDMEKANHAREESLKYEKEKARTWEEAKRKAAEVEVESAKAREAAQREATRLAKEQAKAWAEAKSRVLPQQIELTKRQRGFAAFTFGALFLLCVLAFFVGSVIVQERQAVRENLTQLRAQEQELRSKVEIERLELERDQIEATRSQLQRELLDAKLEVAREMTDVDAIREAYFALHAAALDRQFASANPLGNDEGIRELLVLKLTNRLYELFLQRWDQIMRSSVSDAEKRQLLYLLETNHSKSRSRVLDAPLDKLRQWEKQQFSDDLLGQNY